VTDFQRKFFFESLFYKALQMYTKGVSRFSYFLLHKGNIKMSNTKETYENRFNNRLRIFDKCFFLKKLDYETYLNVMKEFHNDSEVLDFYDLDRNLVIRSRDKWKNWKSCFRKHKNCFRSSALKNLLKMLSWRPMPKNSLG